MYGNEIGMGMGMGCAVMPYVVRLCHFVTHTQHNLFYCHSISFLYCNCFRFIFNQQYMRLRFPIVTRGRLLHRSPLASSLIPVC